MADDDQDMEMCDDTEFPERVVPSNRNRHKQPKEMEIKVFNNVPHQHKLTAIRFDHSKASFEIQMMEQYKGTTFRELNPHLFAAADDSCSSTPFILRMDQKQVVTIKLLQIPGKAYGPLPDPPCDGNDNSYAVNQAMSIRYREIKKPNKLTKSPYGIDTPSHRPNGRFSNGLNIPDIISEHLGSEPVLRYLSPVLTDKNLPLGVNFASVGIGILNATRFQFLGHPPDLATYNTLINGLVQSDRVFEAVELFKKIVREKLCEPNQISYGTIINGFRKVLARPLSCSDKMVDQALELFAKMIEKGIRADVITYSFLIHGLCIFRRETEAAKLLIDMEEKGIPPDIHTYTILVNAFCKQGPVKDAELAVQAMKDLVPSIITYNTLINGYCKKKKISEAMNLFREIPNKGLLPNVSTYNTLLQGLKSDMKVYTVMIRVFLEEGLFDRAIELLKNMEGHVLLPLIPRVGQESRMRNIIEKLKDVERKDGGIHERIFWFCVPPVVRMELPYMSVERRGLTALGAINSYPDRVVTNGDGTSVPISTVFGRLREMLHKPPRAMVGPISVPVQFNVCVLTVLAFIRGHPFVEHTMTTHSPHMFVESLGLTGWGVTNSSDGRVVTRAYRTTVPISTVFGRFKDMPVSSAEADFTADTDADLRGCTPQGSYDPINNRSRGFGYKALNLKGATVSRGLGEMYSAMAGNLVFGLTGYRFGELAKLVP
ncbi:putative tetratricopeptide-like helical domain-containing protein [Tanacetum coccineum]